LSFLKKFNDYFVPREASLRCWLCRSKTSSTNYDNNKYRIPINHSRFSHVRGQQLLIFFFVGSQKFL